MKTRPKSKQATPKALALLAELPVGIPGAPSGVRFTETGLVVERRFTKEEWHDLGKKLLAANKASKWWLADWMVMGPNESDFKDSAMLMDKQRTAHRRIERGLCVVVGDALGLTPGHVSNVARVGKCVPPKYREGLTVAHATAILQQVPDKDLPIWRDKVIRERLSVRELRIQLRQSLRTEKRSPKTSRPPIAAAEFQQCVRTFNAESDNWTNEQWECYEGIFEPIIKAFTERSRRRV